MSSKSIYIASSWKGEQAVKDLAVILRADGHLVDCFCDSAGGRFIFHWSELVGKEEDLKNYNAISFLKESKVQKAFKEDKKWLDWSEVVIMVRPCGNSAHLEAGYAKGKGKYLYIYGDFPPGEFDVMYGFADGLYSWDKLNLFRKELLK